MTITLGFWVVPAIITLVGLIGVGAYKPRGDYDFGPAILGLVWLVATIVAWAMWGLSWLV